MDCSELYIHLSPIQFQNYQTMSDNDVILDPPPPHPFIFFRHDPLYLKIILLLLYRILILDKKNTIQKRLVLH